MEYGVEDFKYGLEMEWKKSVSMKYAKSFSILLYTMPWS